MPSNAIARNAVRASTGHTGLSINKASPSGKPPTAQIDPARRSIQRAPAIDPQGAFRATVAKRLSNRGMRAFRGGPWQELEYNLPTSALEITIVHWEKNLPDAVSKFDGLRCNVERAYGTMQALRIVGRSLPFGAPPLLEANM